MRDCFLFVEAMFLKAIIKVLNETTPEGDGVSNRPSQ